MTSPSDIEVFILGTAYPLRGGLASFNERLARAFKDAGYRVTIYNFSLQYPSFFFPGKTQYSTDSPPEGLDILSKVNSINPFNWLKIGREIRNRRPRLLVLRYWMPFMAPCMGTIARIVKKNHFTKIVAITDNIIPHEARFYDSCLSKYFLKSCHGFIAMSKTVLDDIGHFDKTKPRKFYPHPLYDNYGEPISRKEACHRLNLDPSFNYMLFFGFIRQYKGLDILLQAFADQRFEKLPLKLLIAGEFYIDPRPYYRMIDELKLSQRIVMHDSFISNSEIPAWFCAADLIVQPYKSATQSGVTQIAYYFEKPMIVTNVGGLPEMVPDGKAGYIVEPEPKSLAEAILKFFSQNNPKNFVRFIKEEKQKFTWEGLVKTFEEFL